MLITELYDGQGLGNQLWVYAAVRSIAEQLDVPFVLLGADRFKGKNFLNIESEVGISTFNVHEIERYTRLNTFNEILYYDKDLDYFSSSFDFRVLALRGLNKLNGLYQSEKYFFGDMERPKRYFKLDDAWRAKNPVQDDTCIINLRGGEYKRHKNLLLPESYWAAAIENMRRISNVNKFLVVTDDIRYAKSIFPKFEVLKGEVGDCYATLYNAKYLILSNSSFAYFPVKTGGNFKFVIAPQYWARYANTHSRWASPANLYDSWFWQAADGNLYTSEECILECDAAEVEYESKYFVRTTIEQVQKPAFRQVVPAGIRRKIKQSLGVFFPRHFG